MVGQRGKSKLETWTQVPATTGTSSECGTTSRAYRYLRIFQSECCFENKGSAVAMLSPYKRCDVLQLLRPHAIINFSVGRRSGKESSWRL